MWKVTKTSSSKVYSNFGNFSINGKVFAASGELFIFRLMAIRGGFNGTSYHEDGVEIASGSADRHIDARRACDDAYRAYKSTEVIPSPVVEDAEEEQVLPGI